MTCASQPVRDLAEAAGQEGGTFHLRDGHRLHPVIELAADIPDLVTETAIRAITEGLTNVARHAQAKHVSLALIEMWERIGDRNQ